MRNANAKPDSFLGQSCNLGETRTGHSDGVRYMTLRLDWPWQLAVAGVRDAAADHACSHLSKAVAIATLLRGTSFHAQRWYTVTSVMTSFALALGLRLGLGCQGKAWLSPGMFPRKLHDVRRQLRKEARVAGDTHTCRWTCALERCALGMLHISLCHFFTRERAQRPM